MIEYQSNDVIKSKFVKLWDLKTYLEKSLLKNACLPKRRQVGAVGQILSIFLHPALGILLHI